MEQRPFGSTKRLVAAIGQGTRRMGMGDAECLVALRAGLDAGMTHIDTAEKYGQGQAEELIAEAIANRRHEVTLVSKVNSKNASRKGTIEACEQSLRRLRTDYLDVYLLHRVSKLPLTETFAAFDDLLHAGKIKAFGVSNFDVENLEKAESISGPGRIACNQVIYHLERRQIEKDIMPWCREHGVAVVGYSPFAFGNFPPSSPGTKVLREIADVRAATMWQVALRFLVRNPIVFAIPKASDPAHALQNAAASDLVLDADEIERIDKAFPVPSHAL